MPRRIRHLRGNCALPDQVIQRPLLAAQHRTHLIGGAEMVTSRADRFVCFLRAFGFRAVDTGLVRHDIAAVQFSCLGARRTDCLARQRGRIGTHIGDVTGLVQGLRRAHR